MNANDIQEWIDHLNDEEKHIPIYLKEQDKYYNADSVMHCLQAVRVVDGEEIAPNDFFEVKIHRMKDAGLSKYMLEHPLPFKEILYALHTILDKYELMEGTSCTDEVCRGLIDVLAMVREYDLMVTREYLKYADLHEEEVKE